MVGQLTDDPNKVVLTDEALASGLNVLQGTHRDEEGSVVTLI